jgi:hypothetical protein
MPRRRDLQEGDGAMPFEPIPGTDVKYALLSFDPDGKERTDDPGGRNGLMSQAILEGVRSQPPSHVFLFSHGWKGDVVSARDQYGRWIKAMLDCANDVDAMPAPFQPLWIGLHWPSLPFGDEELAGADFDMPGGAWSPAEVVATFQERLGLGAEAEPLLRTIVTAHQQDAAATELPPDVAAAYMQLARLAGYRGQGPEGPPDADGGAFDPDLVFHEGNAVDEGASFGGGGGLIGGLLGPLRQLSYWTMKKRARTIGETGMHQFVADLMKAAPQARIHLMGHSFGCIVVSSILGGPKAAQSLPRKVDSLVLLQGAVSLWSFGTEVHGKATPGYFNPCLERTAVRGPIVVSRSIHDHAVGRLYPWASAVSLADGSFAIDEDNPPLHGAIGSFGIRGVQGATLRPMLDVTGTYGFEAGRIYNLESSKFIAKGDGVSGAHSDIDGPQVAHALWQAAIV